MQYKAFESLQTPVWIYDIERFEMVWANRSALKLWEADTLKEFLARDFTDISASTRSRLTQYNTLFARGETVQETWTFYPKGASSVQVQCLCSGIELPDGRTAMLVEGHLPQKFQIAADTLRSVEMFVTSRHEMEDALRQRTEMLQAIVENIPIMLAYFDRQGNIQFINQALADTLGWSLQAWQDFDLLAKCYPDPEYRQRVLNHMRSADGEWRDFETLTATGQVIHTSWTNIRLSDGRNIGIGQDITQRKRNEEAQNQQAMRDRFMMEISQHISRSLDLGEVLGIAVSEMHRLLETDRVLVYKVDLDKRCGTVIAEAVADGYPSLKGTPLCGPYGLEEHCEECALLKVLRSDEQPLDQIRSMPDLALLTVTEREKLHLERCHTRAFLAAPILQNSQLWGAIILQNYFEPRTWQSWEVHLLKQLTEQVTIAIQQAEL